jgi:CBS domain-containing protein
MEVTATKEISASSGNIPAKEVMDPNPVTVSPRMTIHHAATLMKEKDVPCLIVVRKDEPIGCLTESDLTRRVVAMNLKPNQITVKEVMSTPVVQVGPEVDITSIARTMASTAVRILAVVDDGKLVGIITQRDLSILSPAFLELYREHVRIGKNGDAANGPNAGYCQVCQSYTEDLIDDHGLVICRECLK